MFAVVGRWKLDPGQLDLQREVLTRRIVPGVSQSAGFVAGYWSEPTERGDAYSFIIFDDSAPPKTSQNRCGRIDTTVGAGASGAMSSAWPC